MSENQFSNRQILKVTSLFGGVQFLNILFSIIRSKLVALLLGPAGMGTVGLLSNTINLLSSFTNFGLETSAIKSISLANQNEDKAVLETEIGTLQRLAWLTGIFGTIITIVFSSSLSLLVFGTRDFTYPFIWIAVTLLLRQITVGQLTVLQGLRKFAHLAKANLLGSFLGLVFTIPLYYFWGLDAIVPVLLVSSLTSLFCSWYFFKKITFKAVKLSTSEVFANGKGMIKLGFSLSFIGLLTLLTSYILQIIISKRGGVTDVGLFNAGFAIINTYVGMIFTAISVDYFPRLTTVSHNDIEVRNTVVQQAILSVLIITPIIVIFLTFAPFIIKILYSKDFIAIIPMVSWGILGMLFKAVSWTMGFILIAKEDSKIFIKTALGFNIIFLINNYLAYYFYGLEGLGMTFFLNYIIHYFSLKIITYSRYNFYFSKEFYKIFVFSIVLCLVTYLFSYISLYYIKYGLMILMSVCSIAYTCYQLDKKVNLKEIIISKLQKEENGK